MLTVATVASGAAGYYMDKDNYYFLGNLESRWLGKGAESLGLEGPVLASLRDAYVAFSRSKVHVQVYTENLKVLSH